MKLALAVLAVLAAVAVADDVVTLTTENFDSIIEENEFVLVEFFAPWCGHCKNLAPHYAKAATTLKEDGIVLGAVDATIEKDLASKFGVRGYPTLKLFKNGKATEYKGGRTEDTIVSYIRKATGPPAKDLADAAAVGAFIEGSKVVVVGYFSELSGAEYDAFIETAKADEDNSFGVTTDADAAAAAGVTAPAIVLHKQFDEGKNVFDGAYTQAEIASFVAANRMPLIIPFTMDVAGDLFQSSIGKIAFLFTDDEAPEYFTEVATAFKGKYLFSTAPSHETRLTDYLGVSKEDFPVFFIVETGGNMRKFPMSGDVSASSVRAHIESHASGELKPTFKSEPIPENNDGPVTVIVGKNFESIVLDENKNVLLEVYAPWCGHCKKLEPIYKKLGQHFAKNDDIVIAKMDGTANEVDGLNVRGFPTIKFFPKGAKTVASAKDYNGGRELDDFVEYLSEYAEESGAAHEEL
jgi:protein disulfide-isomerase A1